MSKGLRKCIVCGSEYTYCPKCGKGDKNETWRYLYDTELCNKVFDIVSSFSNKHIDKDDAKKKLEALNIPRGMKFNTEIKNQINIIMATEPKVKEKQIVKDED